MQSVPGRLGDPATLRYMQTLVQGSVGYIRELSHQHAPGTVSHHHGGDDHLAYLERPFLEAGSAGAAAARLRRSPRPPSPERLRASIARGSELPTAGCP